jgi:hypothetical protein
MPPSSARRRLLLAALGAALLPGAAAPAAAGAGPEVVANPYANRGDTRPTRLNRLVTFGDSWSNLQRTRGRVRTWNFRLTSRAVTDYSVSGTTAVHPNPVSVRGPDNTLRTQVDRFLARPLRLGPNDLTVVYVGNDDVRAIGNGGERPIDINRATRELTAQLDRLLAAGVANDGRYLFVAMIQPIQDVPESLALSSADRAEVRARTLAIVQAVARYADSRARVVAVNLYTAFEAVRANPARFGLRDVTGFSRPLSDTTFLYADDHHFGNKGQVLLERVFNYYLTRGFEPAVTLGAGSAMARRLRADIEAGLVF